MELDIHNRNGKHKSIVRKLNISNICEENKKLILNFVEYKKEEDSIGIPRQSKYIGQLRILAEHINKPFDKLTKEDVRNLITEVLYMDVKRGETKKKMSEHSKADYVIVLKVFFKWLKGSEHPEETDWIKPIKLKNKRMEHNEILNWEDVVLLSKSAMNPRDKAIPQVLFESGVRIEELLTLLIKDVEPINKGEALILHLRKSKTELRDIAIVRSAPALINWMENHPLRSNRDATLWVQLSSNNKPMNYDTARKALVDLKKRSGLNKPVNPHNFRKSSASDFSHRGFTEFEVKKRFGWIQSSKMFDIYVHPDEQRINDKLLQMEGVIEKTRDEKQKEDENLKPKTCGWCSKLNPVGQEYCVLCKRPLNENQNLLETIDDGMMEFTKQNPELINKFIQFIKAKAESS